MRIEVTHEQFEVGIDEVVHRPTGAKFTAYPGDYEMKGVHWGNAGNLLPSNEEYERVAVLRVAQDLLKDLLKVRQRDG